MICTGSDPKQLRSKSPYDPITPYTNKEPWNYSKITCDSSVSGGGQIEEIIDPVSGKSFFLDKTISYGNGLTSFFAIAIVILLIMDFVFHIILKRN